MKPIICRDCGKVSVSYTKDNLCERCDKIVVSDKEITNQIITSILLQEGLKPFV